MVISAIAPLAFAALPASAAVLQYLGLAPGSPGFPPKPKLIAQASSFASEFFVECRAIAVATALQSFLALASHSVVAVADAAGGLALSPLKLTGPAAVLVAEACSEVQAKLVAAATQLAISTQPAIATQLAAATQLTAVSLLAIAIPVATAVLTLVAAVTVAARIWPLAGLLLMLSIEDVAIRKLAAPANVNLARLVLTKVAERFLVIPPAASLDQT